MLSLTDQYWVTLHSRDCKCNQCRCWYDGFSTATAAYTSIMIPRDHWNDLGCPANIEEYYEAMYRKQNVCPCCGQSKTFSFNFSI